MDNSDYLSLIAVLTEQLDQLGAGELAEPQHYVRQDFETGEYVLLEPRLRLLEMLTAFDRFLAVRDRTTLDEALERMNRHEIGAPVKTVEVLPTPGEGASKPVNLGSLEYLSEVRAPLQQLIFDLQHDEER